MAILTRHCLALSQILREFHDKNGRPAVLAIDGTMWLVEIEKATKEHYKTAFFNRVLQFYSMGWKIIMVFDGPHKIKKHGRGSSGSVGSGMSANDPIKLVCEWMGLTCLVAESEGEALCSLLQREGVADFVFTGDSDSLVYQASRVVRSLKTDRKEPGKGSRTAKRAPSTMTAEDELYNAKADMTDKLVAAVDISDQKDTMQSDSFILFALLTGGDHDTGISRVGPKHAKRVCFPASKYATPMLDLFRNAKKSTDASSGNKVFDLETWEQCELDKLLDGIYNELKNDSNEGRKMGKNLADGALNGMPDHNVLHYYLYNCSSVSKLYTTSSVKFIVPDIYSIWAFAKEIEWPLHSCFKFILKLLLTWILSPYSDYDLNDTARTMIEIKGVLKTAKNWQNTPLPEKYRLKVHPSDMIHLYFKQFGDSGIYKQDQMLRDIEALDHDPNSIIELLVPKMVMRQNNIGLKLVKEFEEKTRLAKEAVEKTNTRKAARSKCAVATRSKSMLETWLAQPPAQPSKSIAIKSLSVSSQKPDVEAVKQIISVDSDTDSEIEVVTAPRRPFNSRRPGLRTKSLQIDQMFSSDSDSDSGAPPSNPTPNRTLRTSNRVLSSSGTPVSESSQKPRNLAARRPQTVSKSINQFFESSTDSDQSEGEQSSTQPKVLSETSADISGFLGKASPLRFLGKKRELSVTPVKQPASKGGSRVMTPMKVDDLFTSSEGAEPTEKQHTNPLSPSKPGPQVLSSARPAATKSLSESVDVLRSSPHKEPIRRAQTQTTLSFALGLSKPVEPVTTTKKPAPRRAAKKTRSLARTSAVTTANPSLAAGTKYFSTFYKHKPQQATLDSFFSSTPAAKPTESAGAPASISSPDLEEIGFLETNSTVFKAAKDSFTSFPPQSVSHALSFSDKNDSNSDDRGSGEAELELAFEEHFQNIVNAQQNKT